MALMRNPKAWGGRDYGYKPIEESMKQYKVTASYRTFLEATVEASSEEEAYKIAEQMALDGEMKEVSPFDSDFSIDGVKLVGLVSE